MVDTSGGSLDARIYVTDNSSEISTDTAGRFEFSTFENYVSFAVVAEGFETLRAKSAPVSEEKELVEIVLKPEIPSRCILWTRTDGPSSTPALA